jgi:AraC-like DNA-binding protein
LNNGHIFFNLNPINFFIVSGLIQNFILATILFFRLGESRSANKILSVTILIVNLHLSYLMVLDTNLDNLIPELLWFPFSYVTAVGPLIFYYTKALTDTSFQIKEVNIKHFIPVGFEVAIQLVMIIQAANTDILLYNTPLYFYVMPVLYAGSVVSIFYYLRLSVAIINNHETWALRNFSNLKEVTLTWLKKLLRYYRVLWSVWIPFAATFLLFFRFQLMYIAVVLALYLLMLVLTYVTCWIGIEGLGRGTLVFVKQPDTPSENKNFSRLSSDEIQHYAERILAIMSGDKIFLNENLSLRELAAKLNTDPNLISFVLNNHMSSTFYDFVNRYRVEEVKQRMTDSSYSHLTLLGIALESGFNSKTTFNRVFKQLTGQTPSEFQKDQQNSQE